MIDPILFRCRIGSHHNNTMCTFKNKFHRNLTDNAGNVCLNIIFYIVENIRLNLHQFARWSLALVGLFLYVNILCLIMVIYYKYSISSYSKKTQTSYNHYCIDNTMSLLRLHDLLNTSLIFCCYF